MWLSLAKLAFKTGSEVYKNKQETKVLQSQAERTAMARMATGEVEYKAQIIQAQKNDLKDEIVLILISIPLLIAAWGVFSEDAEIAQKLNIFFDQVNKFPLWLQGLIIGGYSSVLGIKGINTFKKK